MDDKTFLGNIGEVKVAAYFAERGYHVFLPLGSKSGIDLVIEKDGTLERVQVKTTTAKDPNSGSWIAQLRSVRSNKTMNVIKKFDGKGSDILAVYIAPEDRIEILRSIEYDGRSAVSFKTRRDNPMGDGTALEKQRA